MNKINIVVVSSFLFVILLFISILKSHKNFKYSDSNHSSNIQECSNNSVITSIKYEKIHRVSFNLNLLDHHYFSDFVQSQISLVTSEELIAKVISELNLQNINQKSLSNYEFRENLTFREIKNTSGVGGIEGADSIEIEYKSDQPVLAEKIIDLLIYKYIKELIKLNRNQKEISEYDISKYYIARYGSDNSFLYLDGRYKFMTDNQELIAQKILNKLRIKDENNKLLTVEKFIENIHIESVINEPSKNSIRVTYKHSDRGLAQQVARNFYEITQEYIEEIRKINRPIIELEGYAKFEAIPWDKKPSCP